MVSCALTEREKQDTRSKTRPDNQRTIGVMGEKIGVNKWAEAGARRGGRRCARLACTKLRLCFRLYKLRRAFYSRNAQFDEKIQLCDVLCRTEISPCLPAAAERIPLFFACRLASVRPPVANPKHHPCTAVNDALSRVRASGVFRFFPSLLHPLCAIG